MSRGEQVLAFSASILPALLCIPLARQRPPGRLAACCAVIVAGLTVAWDRHKAPYEGPAILQLGGSSGVTVVDLVVPVALAVAAAVIWRHWRGRPASDVRPPRPRDADRQSG